jgi:hypothetical protein
MNLNKILLTAVVIVFAFVVFETMVSIIPWYRMKSIEIIYPKGKKAFIPGDVMKIKVVRDVLISFEAHTAIALIKLSKDYDEIVWQTHQFFGVRAGSQTTLLSLNIPTLLMVPFMTGNSYIWRAIMTYKPLGGPDKTLVFKTEEFHIEIPGNG